MFLYEIFNAHIQSEKINYKIHYIETTESTNQYAWDLKFPTLTHGNIIITKNQTNGFGRRGTKWLSSKNKSLTFSLILKEQQQYNHLLSLKIGISIVEGIKQDTGINTTLKWPNDIMINNKKIGGILIEKKKKMIVVGIGINVKENYNDLHPMIKNQSTSLNIIDNSEISIEKLLANILNKFEKNYYEKNSEKIIKKWETKCAHMNKNIKFHNNKIITNGIFKGINKNGAAIINIHGNKKIIFGGGIEL